MPEQSLLSNSLDWSNVIANEYSKLSIIRHKRAKSQYDKTLFYINNKPYYSFVSNDYLGLTCHENLIQAMSDAAKKFGVGSTGAATLSGYSELHQQLSELMAQWLNFEKCLIFPSGYQLDTGIFSALTNPNSIIWFDKRCHASHIDGILLSKSKFISFAPEDFSEIAIKISNQKNKLHIILTEGVFSMDGICTYLEEALKLKKNNLANVLLIIDDAHGIATLGANGRGSLEPFGFNLIDILIGTFGKGFGVAGGFIVASHKIIDYLSQTVRSQLFTTSISPAIVAATIASMSLIKDDYGISQRLKLANNIKFFQETALKNNLVIYNANINYSPVQLIILNDEQKTSDLCDSLMKSGFFVGKICYPTVAKNKARLRISLNAEHTMNNISTLIESIAKKIKEYD